MDRTYNVGLRYEFHPLNSSSPHQDNACTATRVLQNSKQGGPPPTESRMNGVADADVSNGHTKLWTSLAVGGLAAVSLVAVALARRSRKSNAGWAGIDRPDGLTYAFVFRRCPKCQQHNVVKDEDFTCAICGRALPQQRNIDPEPVRDPVGLVYSSLLVKLPQPRT